MTAQAARHIVETAMDGRALGLLEERLLRNDTPEADCITDHLEVLAKHADLPAERDAIAALIQLVREIYATNQLEGVSHTTVAGIAEGLARHLRRQQAGRLTAKAIARRLSHPLAVIADPCAHDAIAYVHAVRAVDDVIAQVPAEQLLSRAVHHELRNRKYQLLAELHASRERAEAVAA